MPTTPGGALASETLDPKQAQAKFATLITEVDLDNESPASAPSASEPAPEAPTAPAESPQDTEASPQDQPSSDEPGTYTVKVDGQELSVDLDELKAGYRFNAYNEKKSRDLAEEKRAFEADREAAQADRKRYQQGISDLADALQQLQAEPDWSALKAQDPGEYLRQKAEWEFQQGNIRKLREEADREKAKGFEADRQQELKYLRLEQDRLHTAVPEWKDPDKWRSAYSELSAVAKHYGFSQAEIDVWKDHRAFLVLRDAAKYRELHREPTPAVKAKVSSIKPAKPGTPERPKPNQKQEQLIAQAAKSGRQRDAMSAILAMLPD